MLIHCFYHLEDFTGLVKLTDVVTEGQPLLTDIGAKLQSVGLCSDAVAAYIKVNQFLAYAGTCPVLPLRMIQHCRL